MIREQRDPCTLSDMLKIVSHVKANTSNNCLLPILVKKTLKLSESAKLAIKDAELQFCVRGYHSFNSLENDGLNALIQTFVNIAGKYGVFELKDLLHSRNTISSFFREKAVEIKKSLELTLVEPLETESVAVTLNLWTSNYNNNSYLNVHAFWIGQSFQIKHQCLANCHFGTERHTAGNIAKTIQNILCEYGIDVSNITANTDHGASIVAAFQTGILNNLVQLDCMAHRLHTCFTSIWSRACILEQELRDYENNALALARYYNQAAGLQEQLPVSIKMGFSTRRWTGLIERGHSINVSDETLMKILSESQRDRALLIASVNRSLNSEILKFMQPFSKLFEVLQFDSKPTINFAVLTYYKAAALAKRCPTDNPVIATLKKEFLMVLNKFFFETSLKSSSLARNVSRTSF